MKKALSYYSFAMALLVSVVAAATTSLRAEATSIEKAGIAELSKVDKPVFQFKTTSKDPYALVYRPGSNVLEILTFGYYPGKGAHVFHISKPAVQLNRLMPIRMTKLYIDGLVKIDEKFPGYRESALGRALEEVLMATSVLPVHYYKGQPFVDQYCEGMPFKLVFNNVAEISALRAYLQPLFEQHQLLIKGYVKPALLIHIENAEKTIASGDYDFLKTYFTVCDPADEVVRAFFDKQQDPINQAIAKSKEYKQVKEAFADIIFRQIESAAIEFKVKEVGAAAVYMLLAGVTLDLAKDIARKMTGEAKKHLDHNLHAAVKRYADDPTVKQYTDSINDSTVQNSLLYAGGILGAGLLTAGALSLAGAQE
ncbi:hypothetical protein FJ364_01505 [Candidatus Dependentiae bacterium]|nr:hypothetical protein [Candidatus Dependentiae bacterium]